MSTRNATLALCLILGACGVGTATIESPTADYVEPVSVGPITSVYGAAPQQFGSLLVPQGDGPHPVVVLVHGGFWRARYGADLMEPLAADLVERGYATWNLEYRRVSQPGGGYPGTLSDVAAGIDHLTTLAEAHRLDLERVAVVGHSAGGGRGPLGGWPPGVVGGEPAPAR